MASVRPKGHPLETAQQIQNLCLTFSLSRLAADKNFALLKENDIDLENLLLSDGHSPLQPGLVFRPVNLLQLIVEGHPFWQQM